MALHMTAKASASLRRRSVIVVDDDESLRRVAKRLLNQAGLDDVETVGTFEAAEEILRGRSPDLLLLDIHLGKGLFDGLHLLRRVRARGYNGVAVVVSGDFASEQVSRAAAWGADDFLVKGVHLDFAREIVRILELHYGDSPMRRGPEALTDIGYLRSFGLADDEVALLRHYCDGFDFPEAAALAVKAGKNRSDIENTLASIREKLGVSNQAQLAHRLTICMMFHQPK